MFSGSIVVLPTRTLPKLSVPPLAGSVKSAGTPSRLKLE